MQTMEETLTEQSERGNSIMEKVTIWYRCTICSGCLPSIPKLQKHLANAHQKQMMELPDNLPPGAKDGKLYFTYNLSYNKPPPLPYPYECLKTISNYQSKSALYSTPCKTKQPKGSASTQQPHSHDYVQDENDFGIRVRQLRDLQEKPTTGDEEDTDRRQFEAVRQRKPSSDSLALERSPVVSPPDSGIQMHDQGSEFQEDEPLPPQPVVAPPLPSTSTITREPMQKSQNGKLPCPNCDKQFRNLPSLNFHKNKFHPRKSPVVTIHRDAITGNFVTSTSQSEEATPVTTSNAKRVRKSSTGSELSGDNTTIIPPKKKSNSMTEENSEKAVTSSSVKRKPGPKSRTMLKDPNASDSEWEGNRRSSLRSKRIAKVITSESSAQESEEHSETETPDVSPVKPKRRNLRQRGNQGKNQESEPESDSSNSPIARKTRARSRRMKSPTPNESESDSHTDSDASEDIEGSQSEEELSDRSTTPEGSIVPPSLTNDGTSDDDDSSKVKKNKNNDSSKIDSPYSSSDSEDLFIPVVRKRKKVSTSVNKSGEGSNDKSSEDFKVPQKKKGSGKKTSKSVTPEKSPDSRTFCKLCNRNYENATAYITHLYKMHKKEDVGFDCGYCHQRFTVIGHTVGQFNEHIKVHKAEIEKKRKQI